MLPGWRGEAKRCSGGSGPHRPDEYVLENYPRERGVALSVSRTRARQRADDLAADRRPAFEVDGQLRWPMPSDGKLVGSPSTPPFVIEQYRRLAATLHELQADTG